MFALFSSQAKKTHETNLRQSAEGVSETPTLFLSECRFIRLNESLSLSLVTRLYIESTVFVSPVALGEQNTRRERERERERERAPCDGPPPPTSILFFKKGIREGLAFKTNSGREPQPQSVSLPTTHRERRGAREASRVRAEAEVGERADGDDAARGERKAALRTRSGARRAPERDARRGSLRGAQHGSQPALARVRARLKRVSQKRVSEKASLSRQREREREREREFGRAGFCSRTRYPRFETFASPNSRRQRASHSVRPRSAF